MCHYTSLKHPGTKARKALQVQNRRNPEVIQAEKEKRRAAKEAREELRRAEASQKEIAQRNLEECRARQAVRLQHEDEAEGESSLSILSFQHHLIVAK